MTLEKLFFACNNMNFDDVYEIIIVDGIEMNEYHQYNSFHDIPLKFKMLTVKNFDIGETNFILLHSK